MPRKIRLPIASLSPYEDLKAAKDTMSARYLRPRAVGGFRALAAASSPRPENNLSGIGVGEKYVEGRPTGILAVKFLVRIKYPKGQLSAEEMLPEEIDGMPVDVEEVGIFRRIRTTARKAVKAPSPRTKIRPAQPGSSVGFESPLFRMAGTFGAVATDGERRYVLSNNHVLANEDQLPAGAPIFQPGLLDGGNPATDQIAALTRAVPLQATTFNKVDAAIAEVTDPALVKRDILFIGPPAGVQPAQIDMAVHKFGRTTSYTVGRVTSINTDVTVQYEVGEISFEDQILIVGRSGSQFSAAGDSGSLILERGTNYGVGLLFAGSRTHTIANHLGDVLQALGVSLL